MSTFNILNHQALDELRSLAAGTIHTYALARMHGRNTNDAKNNMDDALSRLELVEQKLKDDLATVQDSIKMMRNLRATLGG